MEDFPLRLRRVIASTPLDLMSFADVTDVGYGVLKSWLKGPTKPMGMDWLCRLKRARGCTWAEVFEMSRKRWGPDEPYGVAALRRIRSRTGCTWEELLGE